LIGPQGGEGYLLGSIDGDGITIVDSVEGEFFIADELIDQIDLGLFGGGLGAGLALLVNALVGATSIRRGGSTPWFESRGVLLLAQRLLLGFFFSSVP